MPNSYPPLTATKMSVGIPALNEEGNITASIQAAHRDYTPDQVEIVVVDGGSTDATLSLMACGDCTETYDPASDRWNTTRVWRECAAQGRAAGGG